jgi:hypothetical protein
MNYEAEDLTTFRYILATTASEVSVESKQLEINYSWL